MNRHIFPVGLIPVRVELADGTGMWRGIRNLDDHGELCRAFGLDPVATSFDLPSSARGVGSYSSGNRGNRRISGYVLRYGQPIGKLHVAYEGERFRDDDPCDTKDTGDFWRL